MPEPVHPADWADEHHRLSKETTGKAGDWVTRPYQRGIFALFCSDDVDTVDVMKCARMGLTQVAMAASAYDLAHRRRSGISYMPNDDDRDRFNRTHAKCLLRDCAVLRDSMVRPPEVRGTHNVAAFKEFDGAVWHLLGGFSATNFRDITVDWVGYDELDGFVGDVGGEEKGEGGPTELGDTRMETSPYPKSRRISTPTVAGFSRIEASVQNADVVLWRYLPCDGCGGWFRLTMAQMKWDSGRPDTVRHECPHCAHETRYPDMADMDRRGRWQSDAEESGAFVWMDDDARFFDETDERIEPFSHVAVRLWSAYSYERPWSYLIGLWLKANAAKKRGNIKPLKTFINTKLGETWEDEGETVDEHALKRNREPYAHDCPEGVTTVVFAVDVQDDRLEFERVGFGEGEESWGLGYHKRYGDIGRREIWDLLEREIHTPLSSPEGSKLPSVVLIDSGGHYTSEVYKFCERNPRAYFATKGHKERNKPIIPPRLPKVEKGQRRPVMIGTDTAKELVYSRYRLVEPGPGYCHYNVDPDAGYDSDYFEGATSEVAQKKFSKGFGFIQWVKKPTVRNEPLDLRVLATAGVRMLQKFSGLRLGKVAKKPAQKKPATRTPSRGVQRSRPRGWVNGWRA